MGDLKYEALKLENQICFPLYACSREIIKKYKPFLDEIGITYTQYIVLMVLWENKSMNVKELGEKLFLDSGTLTPVLKALETKGLLIRERLKKDERFLRISITNAGEQLKEKAVSIPHKMASCTNLSLEEGKMLYQILYKILNDK